MKSIARVFLFVTFALALGQLSKADDSGRPGEPPPIHWIKGPTTAKLGDLAEINIPKGYVFADGEGTRKFLELTHNPTSGAELGIIAPEAENDSWFVLFEFDEVGFIKDDEKASLDPKKILAGIQKNTERANEERQKRGWKAFHVNGWYTEPYYDTATNNLTWAVNGSEDNGVSPTVNYSVRILGRRGTMNVDLVLDPKDMTTVDPSFRTLLTGYHFTGGNRYADFAKGDKVASYGLTALIAGGATAAAIKTGLFAKFWKLLVFLFAATVGGLKKLWAKTKSAVSGEAKTEFPPAEPGA